MSRYTPNLKDSARMVQEARLDLLAALADQVDLPRRIAAYTKAVGRYRECLLAELILPSARSSEEPERAACVEQ